MSTRERYQVAVGFFVAIIIVVTGGYAFATVRKANDKATCLQIELLKEPIRNSIADSIKQLPQLDYYKQHPAELKKALADSNRTLANFAPKTC